MDVHFTCYGCPLASMGVLTPIVEYNSPPMAVRTSTYFYYAYPNTVQAHI